MEYKRAMVSESHVLATDQVTGLLVLFMNSRPQTLNTKINAPILRCNVALF
jgi:hypothetical protein